MKNKKKDLYEEFSSTLIWFLIGLVIICLSIALSFKFSKYGNELKIQDYFAYVGAFGGAILSAGISFFILFITIERGKIEQEENMLNSSRPVIKVESKFINYGTDDPKIYYEKQGVHNKKDRTYIEFIIKNIGNGPARNIVMNLNETDVTTYTGINEKFDLGCGEHKYINIIASYDDITNRGQDNCMKIICEDIFSKRQYEYEIAIIKDEENNYIIQMIEENIIKK